MAGAASSARSAANGSVANPRSGIACDASRAAPAGGGKKKIDLANIGTVQVLDLLGPTDRVTGTGVIDGEVALRADGDGLWIHRGEFHARTPGTLQVTDTKLRERVAAKLKEVPGDPWALGAMAELKAHAGEYGEAVALLSQARAKNPDDEFIRTTEAGGMTAHHAHELPSLLDDFDILAHEEVNRQGSIGRGIAKWWHVHHVIARKK